MKYRKFGKTGLSISLLGFGGFHLLEIEGDEAGYLLNSYIDKGGNYIETAAGYGDGESEIKIGKALGDRRKDVILATKSSKRNKVEFIESVNRSLKNLCTDYLDLVIMHAVGTIEELDAILGEDGAMEGFLQLRREGKVGFVGISMHGRPHVLIEALKRYPFDAVMTTINYYDRFNFPDIESELLPLAMEKGTAVILMKPIADGLLYQSARQAFRYAMSMPVSVVVTGMNTREMLEADLSYAEEYTPMSQKEMQELFKNAPELGNYVCRQCGNCVVCPNNINIPDIFKLEGWYDRQMRDGIIRDAAQFALRDRLRFWFGAQEVAKNEYSRLSVKADQCNNCGFCSSKCPYNIDIERKLKIADYKLSGKKYY